jgi:eukaryotic-like serine/threonine-protein kinase
VRPPDDETRLAEPADVPSTVELPRRTTSTTGWSQTTTEIDHGRFAPGSILDQRYRIVGRLGKGGMGEVYRADDLRLGQPVALKFLPESVDRDPARLTQLHTEVRMARQVSHPNVCRVYDVGEYEGHTFLSMEYVDGEDLASLLRRIGRFPQDRAIELTRQICAGLAAAHDRGVVHRDLKPANIMLDGGGKIRITDFGLAGTTGEVLRAGTPAYMAPEQLSGAEVTPRSDIYALGLVLYELFTGQRALDARTMAELIAKREQAGIVPPSELVRDLDADIERVIMRCLQPDPARRPASAIAVAAALPGGDPLAAALAAGETPSPDMVAASGTSEAVPMTYAVAGAAWTVLALAAIVLLYQRVQMINIVDPPKPPAALIDRAQEIVQRLGYGDQVHSSAAGLGTSLDWARFVDANVTGPGRWSQLHRARPETFYLWYRTSPVTLRPVGDENPITGVNPPLRTTGMTLTVVDTLGRLAEFVAVPDPAQGEMPPFTEWKLLFDLAGVPMGGFTQSPPAWVPPVHAEQRVAWEGRTPEVPDHTIRIEAGATRGKPVFFTVNGSWSRSARTPAPAPSSRFTRAIGIAAAFVMPALTLIGPVLAYRNVKRGRGDRRGAFRAASAVFFLQLGAWLLGPNHVGSMGAEQARLYSAIGVALYRSAVLWLTYLGLEPYIRRFSPDSLIGWQRLVSGGWRDARVGRDVMIGVAAGLAMTVVFAAHNLIPPLFGRPEPMPVYGGDLSQLLTVRYSLAEVLRQIEGGLSAGMLGTAGFVVFRILLKRRWTAAIAAVACFVWVVLEGMFNPGWPLLDFVLGLIITTIFVVTIGWAGLLATIATVTTHFLLLRAPVTSDLASWRAPAGLVTLAALLALGVGGAWMASRTAARAPARAAAA